MSKLITDLFIVVRKKTEREKNGKVQGFSPAAFSEESSFGIEYSE